MNNPNRGTSRVTLNWEDPGSTGLVVPVPEAEPLVGHYRRRHTPSGADGMPAHVTVLGPFTPAPLLSVDVIREVQVVLGSFGPFEFVLAETARFDSGTLYLVPEPGDPFGAMWSALTTSFPEHAALPAPQFIPHLTVARSDDAGILEAIEREVARELPLEAVADVVFLLERGADRRWSTRRVFELEPVG